VTPLPADCGDAPDAWTTLRVSRHERVARDIVAIELVAADGGPLPPFEAGACINVLSPGGRLRAYSLANSPAERQRYLIAVLREAAGRGGSVALHDQLRVGDALPVQPPHNAFALAATAVHSLLLAGGIGITPLLAMAHALWARGAPFALHYSVRNAERAAFVDLLMHQPWRGQVQLQCSEQQGRLDLAAALRRTPPASEVYVCGPPGFIGSAVAAFQRSGRAACRLHVEAFV